MPGRPQPTIAILGSGAVGALIGAELTRAGVATTLITRDASAEAIKASGITVTSTRFGDHVTNVAASTTLDEPVDVLLVAVKAPQLANALKRVTTAPAIVVPLLNGVDHMAVLRAPLRRRPRRRRHGPRPGPPREPHASGTSCPVSDHHPRPTRGARARAGAHAKRTSTPRTGAPEADVLWAKLSRLAALALSTTAADAPLGDVRETAEAVAREVAAVATAEGADIDADTIVDELRGLPDSASSSLRADVTKARRDHELDAIGGAVLRAARCHDLLAPHTAELVARVQRRTMGG